MHGCSVKNLFRSHSRSYFLYQEGKHTINPTLSLTVLFNLSFGSTHMETVSNHSNCKSSSLARVVTFALRTARAAVAIRLHYGKVNELYTYFCLEQDVCIL